jgi:HAD superfamily phosphatase (TIGR01668 family)
VEVWRCGGVEVWRYWNGGSVSENRKSKIESTLLLFCPKRFCPRGVTEVSIAELKEQGIEAVLLDLDNTLTRWQSHDVPEEISEWLKELKQSGMKLCLISNTRFGRRLKKMSEELEIPFVKRAWKPRKQGFRSALKDLGVSPDRAVMIGDQMFTDVLGANRSGIYSIMVSPMAHKEFAGTKVSRMMEKPLLAWFRRRGHI